MNYHRVEKGRVTTERVVLILTRSIGESIKIGDDITVTVLAVNGNQAKVGVSAPRDVEVHREEVYVRVQQERSDTE